MEGKGMARPPKQGLDYFPFDVDFFQNKKIKRVKKEYGADGITIYMYLLCEIYKNGYYVIADNDFISSAADDLKMNVNKINQVLRFLLERSLFDSKLFQSDTVLTSVSVQRRYLFAVEERIKNNTAQIEDFWLLKKSDTETLSQVRPFLENPQQKSAKESKRKESKINESILERSAGKTSKALTAPEKEQLIKEFGKELTDEYIKRTTAYHCCNYDMIRQWILEDKKKQNMRAKPKNQFHQFSQREVTQEEMDELERKLLKKNLGL